MRKGSLAFIAILIFGSLTKLIIPQAQLSPAGTENKTSGIPGKPASDKQPSTKELAKKSSEWYPTQLREKIREFFGKEHGADLGVRNGRNMGSASEPVDPPCKISQSYWCVPAEFRNKVHFVIALSPDPVHSHLGLYFDRTIDAIQQGATSQGYLIDRAIMPWHYFDQPTGEETEEDKLLRKERESFPGLMIFRSEKNDPLFVFVVGETPTAGINKEQFHHAVAIIHEIREGKDTIRPQEERDFAVLGPNFSGSLYSLREILKQYLEDYKDVPEIKNVAGTKYVPGTKGRLLPVYSFVMGTQAIQDFQMNAPSQVRMAVFLEDGQAALQELVKYVKGLYYREDDVAVLNEDDTAYGTSPIAEQNSFAEILTQREDKDKNVHGVLNLSFPRGISQFRSAYSKDSQNQDPQADRVSPSGKICD